MDAANQNAPETIPSPQERLEAFTAEIVAGMAIRSGQAPGPAFDTISDLVGKACEGHPANLDTLFSYIAASHALHAAAEVARSAGDEVWAAELHSQGQLFLHYATSDIDEIVTQQARRILASVSVKAGDTVH